MTAMDPKPTIGFARDAELLTPIGHVRDDYFSLECSHVRQLSRVFVSACEFLSPPLDRALQVA